MNSNSNSTTPDITEAVTAALAAALPSILQAVTASVQAETVQAPPVVLPVTDVATKAEAKATRKAENKAKAARLRAMVDSGHLSAAQAEADGLGATWRAMVDNYAKASAAKATKAATRKAAKAEKAAKAAPVVTAEAVDTGPLVQALQALGYSVTAPQAVPVIDGPDLDDDGPRSVLAPKGAGGEALAALGARIARRVNDVLGTGDRATVAAVAAEARQCAAWCEAVAQADPAQAADLRKRAGYYHKAAGTLSAAV